MTCSTVFCILIMTVKFYILHIKHFCKAFRGKKEEGERNKQTDNGRKKETKKGKKIRKLKLGKKKVKKN